MFRALSSPRRDERGQGLTEYALIMLLVAVAAIGVFSAFGRSAANLINNAASTIPH